MKKNRNNKKLFLKRIYLSIAFIMFLSITTSQYSLSQTIAKTDKSELKVSGYIRSGFGRDKDGNDQVELQMPGAPSKFTLANQADTYGELQFSYLHFLNDAKDKSVELRWMASFWQPYDKSDKSLNEWEKLNIRFHNLLNGNEIIWFGKRFYDRRSIYMIDRHWLNQGQTGIGFGMEQILAGAELGGQDIKWGVWRLKRDDVNSYKNLKQDDLLNYLADIRWVKIPITDNYFANFALNYTYREENDELDYDSKHGYGVIGWVDYLKGYISHTTALLYKTGPNIFRSHGTGVSIIENPGNDNVITYDLDKASSLEFNHSFLYDDKEKYAVNATLIGIHRDYGTSPKIFTDNQYDELSNSGSGDTMDWIALGVRPMYYITDNFRLNAELSYEYIDNKSIGVKGNMMKIAFIPELSLSKGFYSMPVLRPYIAYGKWSDDLKGNIASNSDLLSTKTYGLMFGLQFEIWW